MSDGPKPLVLFFILFVVVLLAEMIGPAIGAWAVWLGRLVAGIILVYIVSLAFGGEGSGTLITAVIVVGVAAGVWLLFGSSLMSLLLQLAQIALPILVVIDLVSAFAGVIVGFRNGDYVLIMAGAIAGLIALSSAPAVSEPTITSLIISIVGMIIGVGGFIKRAVQRTFD